MYFIKTEFICESKKIVWSEQFSWVSRYKRAMELKKANNASVYNLISHNIGLKDPGLHFQIGSSVY